MLSGGERSRLAMIKLLLEPANFLILDEPTNHLDMRTKDVLKEAILAFDGTVIIVSHDRDFLNGLVSKVYEFGGGIVREHIGGIYDFLQKKEIETLDELHTQGSPSINTPAKKEKNSPESSVGKLSYEERKEQARQKKKAEKLVEQCEQRVMELEERKTAIELKLSSPDGASDSSLFESYGDIQRQIKEAESAWEEALSALEQIQ